jgi:hypothetical protein
MNFESEEWSGIEIPMKFVVWIILLFMKVISLNLESRREDEFYFN